MFIIKDPLYIGDIDGNGLLDFKIVFWNSCCGAGGDYSLKVYFFNQGKNNFKMIYFYDLFETKERDINHDGNSEITGVRFHYYGKNAYYIYDLYNYKNNRLKNVSKKFGYPIAVLDTDKQIYYPLYKIPLKKLINYSLTYPDGYHSE